jgi:hypothetical protein
MPIRTWTYSLESVFPILETRMTVSYACHLLIV